MSRTNDLYIEKMENRMTMYEEYYAAIRPVAELAFKLWPHKALERRVLIDAALLSAECALENCLPPLSSDKKAKILTERMYYQDANRDDDMEGAIDAAENVLLAYKHMIEMERVA